MLVGIPDNNADTGNCSQFLRRTLGIAAGYQNLSVRVFTMDATDRGARILIGRCRDCTRVEYDDFGLVGRDGAL